MIKTSAFRTSTTGKWILTGEHAVLRGHSAILFPVHSRSLILNYFVSEEELKVEFTGSFGEDVQFLFWSAWERALMLLNIHHADITGNFTIENHIPIGTGMGGSAALSVAIGQFFHFINKVKENDLFEFCRQIENLFHNESSGADIAVTLAAQGILFNRTEKIVKTIELAWHPNWYLSFSGMVSSTSRCVQKVKTLFETNPVRAKALDEQMGQSVMMALEALTLSKEEGLNLLIEAIEQAAVTFNAWGLTEGCMQQHLSLLKHHGALAAKPTGSGGGGFALSLWPEVPPHIPGIEWIRL